MNRCLLITAAGAVTGWCLGGCWQGAVFGALAGASIAAGEAVLARCAARHADTSCPCPLCAADPWSAEEELFLDGREPAGKTRGVPWTA